MTSPDQNDRDFWAWVATLLVLNNRQRHEQIAGWLEKRWRTDWRSLDFHDLMGSTELWLEHAVPDVERAWKDVQNVSASFLDDFLFARAMQYGDSPELPLDVWIDRPTFAEDMIAAPTVNVRRLSGGLVSTGPRVVFNALPAPQQQAMGRGYAASLGYAVSEAMNGGSELLQAVSERNPGLLSGWQRVTDADPCGFCALLASRGPVYRSLDLIAATHAKWETFSKLESADNGARVHANCRCTLIPVYKKKQEPLSGWADVADQLWNGKIDGYFEGAWDMSPQDRRRYFMREYDRYKKSHPDVSDGENAIRRRVEQIFGSNKYVEARQRAVIRSALSKP